ncbi:pyrroline-5-carboxylate reductase [Chloroflexota bacterium]
MMITFIGGGNMGEAMVAAILNKGLSTSRDISVCEINNERCHYLEQKYGVAITNNSRLATEKSEVVVLAVKPQNLTEVMTELDSKLKPEQLVLSIIAGARIDTLRHGLNHDCIIRAMPNTPAQIGEGISVWTATAEVTEPQKVATGYILGAMGREIFVNIEKYIDMATAVSGSGPAYCFLFVESLVDAAIHIGLPHDMAQELVVATMLGSGHFIQKSGNLPVELRKQVTSPGGTTAEALLKLQAGGFSELIKQAIIAAHDKAQKLGQGN